jgi:hypothetical protein
VPPDASNEGYRRELERALKALRAEAPGRAQLQGKLDQVLAEQDDRAKLISNA